MQQALQKNSVSSSVEKQRREITTFDVLMTTRARNIKYLILDISFSRVHTSHNVVYFGNIVVYQQDGIIAK